MKSARTRGGRADQEVELIVESGETFPPPRETTEEVGRRGQKGPVTEQPKILKKRKGGKKCQEKFTAKKWQDMSTEETEREEEEVELAPTLTEPIVVSLMYSPLEKRKPEANEWKALKKIDYQRLETVVEEGQLSGEATSSKQSSDTSNTTENEVSELGHRMKKPWFYNLVSITEHPEAVSGDEMLPEEEHPEEKKQDDQVTGKRQKTGDRKDKNDEAHGEPVESVESNGKQDKKNVMLNGMVEILPIFSNDQFVCSRDAISIEECEELEAIDKTLPASGKFIIDSKTSKDSRTIDIKPFHSMNSVKKGFRDRLVEKLGDFKESVGEKLQPKEQFAVVDKEITGHSSHFINFLLVLSPFAEEREKLFAEKKIKECSQKEVSEIKANRLPSRGRYKKGLSAIQITCYVILTTFCLMMFLLCVAWKSYEPPGIMDYLLCFIPFIHRQRTYLQVFFDKLVRLLK